MSLKEELHKSGEIIELEMKKLFQDKKGYQNRVFQAIEYSFFTGGKRLRPIMAMEAYKLFGNQISKIIPFALAIEMIHTYSLIHDDLPAMDNDDFRRGKPTNHKVYGEAMAILAGDGLLNLAFEVMMETTIMDCKTKEDYEKYTKAIYEVSKCSGIHGMIGGQVVDLLGTHDTMDRDKLMFMYEAKTAALIQAALVSGAIIGGASESEVEIIRNYGLYLGLAYQIKDDILDIEEDEKINKITYLKFHDIKKAEEKVEEFSSKAIECLNSLKDKETGFFRDLTEALIHRKF